MMTVTDFIDILRHYRYEFVRVDVSSQSRVLFLVGLNSPVSVAVTA